jgi:ABC-type transport system involved in multi-copper enzyme maturation permease subunit
MLATTYSLFLRRELPARQTLVLSAACLLPAGIALLLRVIGSGKEFMDTTGASLTLTGPALLVPIFFAVAAFHEEFESRTIVYLLTRPPSRTTYVIGKFLAAWTCSVVAVLFGILVMTIVCSAGRPEGTYYWALAGKLAVTAIVQTGLYCSFFMMFGLVLKNPVIAGLAFTFGWEYVVAQIPGRLQYWTLGIYPKSIFIQWADADPRPFFLVANRQAESGMATALQRMGRAMLSPEMEVPSLWHGLGVSVGLTAVFLVLAAVLFMGREDA